MKLLHRLSRVLLALLFILIFSGCSASSSSRRYNRTSEEKESSPRIRYSNNDTTKEKIPKAQDTQIYNDVADTTSEFDEPPIETKPIDKTAFVKKIEKLESFNVALTPREKVLLEVIKYLDTPYKYGGSTGNGIDCSAFTLQVYKNSLDVDLPRSAREQYHDGEEISKDDLKFGDLVFFNTQRRSKPGHVGIYLGENQFVHASRKLGVTVSSLDEEYYRKRYMGARRIESIPNEEASTKVEK